MSIGAAPPSDILAALRFDPEMGHFTRSGERADHPFRGRMRVTFKGKKYGASRLAWLFFYGVWPSDFVDHIDGNPSNNAIANLRLATNAQNQMNRKCFKGLSKGVTIHRQTGKFQAQVKLDGKNHYLGLFDREEDAHAAYAAKASELFGEFARAA